jgi:hypothetical protein
LTLAACEPGTVSTTPDVPEGPKIEIVEAARAGDTTRVVMRYKDGGAIPLEDEGRAALRAASIACMDGETPITDTRARASGLLTVNVFCIGVQTSDQVVDGSGLRT